MLIIKNCITYVDGNVFELYTNIRVIECPFDGKYDYVLSFVIYMYVIIIIYNNMRKIQNFINISYDKRFFLTLKIAIRIKSYILRSQSSFFSYLTYFSDIHM